MFQKIVDIITFNDTEYAIKNIKSNQESQKYKEQSRNCKK